MWLSRAFLCQLPGGPGLLCVSDCHPLPGRSPIPDHLHETIDTRSVSNFISDLSDGEGCQMNSSAPHRLMSLRRPGHGNPWQDPYRIWPARLSFTLQGEWQRMSVPCRWTAWAPGGLSISPHLLCLPAATSSSSHPTLLSSLLVIFITHHCILRNKRS